MTRANPSTLRGPWAGGLLLSLTLAAACTCDSAPSPEPISEAKGQRARPPTPAVPVARVAFTHVAAGGDSTCVRIGTGAVRCAGRIVGADADGSRAIALPQDVVELAVADRRACARTAAGAVHCWTAPPTQATESTPAVVADVTAATAIRVIDDAACAIAERGTVRCWGERAGKPFAAALAGIEGARAIAFDGPLVILQDRDGKVRHFDPTGAAVERDNDGDEIGGLVGNNLGCVLYRGALRCSGDGFEGNPIEDGDEPSVTHATGVCGRFREREIRCSGWNAERRPTSGRRFQSFLVPDVVTLAAGQRHVCGLLRDGSLWCWGRAAQGQLGARAEQDLLPTDVGAAFRD
ncbi:MAG: RCC1 domain-containing protein [Nannocystaceae bacterium]